MKERRKKQVEVTLDDCTDKISTFYENEEFDENDTFLLLEYISSKIKLAKEILKDV